MDTPILSPMDCLTTSVYEPAEDSFLLLDALEQELESFLSTKSRSSNDSVFALEVGCGSGIISTALAKSFRDKNVNFPCVFAIDINPEATSLTQKNSLLNGLNDFRVQPILLGEMIYLSAHDFIHQKLISFLLYFLDGAQSAFKCFRQPFDLIVCNPPYVPVQSGENPEDNSAGLLEKSWTGGIDGNEFITPFLSNVSKMLQPNGVLYLLLSSWNNPELLNSEIAQPNGLCGTLVIKRTAGRERLSVWKFEKAI